MAMYELYSAGRGDPENDQRDIFAPKKRVSEDEMVAALEAEMRKFIRRDACLAHRIDNGVPQTDEPAAGKLNAKIYSATNDAIECMDRIILDLQDVRNTLCREGECLEREVNNYVNLSHTAEIAARLIAENLAKLKMAPGDFDRPAAERRSVLAECATEDDLL